MNKKIIVFTFVISILGVLLGVFSAILYFLNLDFYGAVGIFSTIISIILGMVSIVYTLYSSKETSDLFENLREQLSGLDEKIKYIESQNKSFVNKIKAELMKNNFDQENIDNIRKNKK